MQEEENIEFTNRPTGFWVLFVLSLINVFLNLYIGFSKLLSGANEQDLLNEKNYFSKIISPFKKYDSDAVQEAIDLKFIFLDAVYANFTTYYLLYFIFYSLGFASLLLMYKRYRVGFHLYISYSFLLLIHNYSIFSPSQLDNSELIIPGLISILLVFLYSKHLKWMK